MPPDDDEIPGLMIDAWNCRDLDAILALVADDVEYVNPLNAVEPGIRRGPEALAEVMRMQWEALAPDGRLEIKETHVRGDQVIVEIVLSRKMPGSDVSIAANGLLSWTIREGEATRLALLSTGADYADARKAAGL